MSNNIIGIVSFLFTMTLEDEFRKIKTSNNSNEIINFPRNEEKKLINSNIENAQSFDKFPDMLIRSDYNGLFNKKIKEGLNLDIFKNVIEKDVFKNNSSFNYDFSNEEKDITLLGAKPWVIVVDHSVDSNIEPPMHWSDLLNIKYENKIGIQGKKNKFCGTLILHMHKEYGIHGIEALANNIKNVWHFTDIIKSLGKGIVSAAPINIMPLANAMMIVNRKPIEIIWPKEGALATPIYMLVKKEKVEELKDYIKYIIGEDFEKLLNKNHFYSIYNKLDDKKLKWLGWQYINDINLPFEQHKEYLNEMFRNKMRID